MYLPDDINHTASDHQMVEVAFIVQRSRHGTKRELKEELDRPDPGDIGCRLIRIPSKLVVALVRSKCVRISESCEDCVISISSCAINRKREDLLASQAPTTVAHALRPPSGNGPPGIMGAVGVCFSASSASAFTAVVSGAGVSVGVGEGSVVGGVPGRVTVADISY